MSRWTAERWAAAAGFLFAIVFVVANLIPGTPPDYNASGSEITAFLDDKYAELTVQAILGGVLVLLFLWFLSSFAGTFRDAGQGRIATIIYGAGVATITIGAVGDAIMIGVTQLAPTLEEPGAVQALYGVSFFLFVKLFWPLALLALAAGFATTRSHALPDWYAYLAYAGGIVFLLAGLSVRDHGFFSPEGWMPLIGFVAFAGWMLSSSALLMKKLAHTPPAATSPAATA